MRPIFETGRRKVSRVMNHAIVRTAAVNLVSVVVLMFNGILLARGLGEEGRGMYAAVVVWFGMSLVAGELGQSVAVTYFVARSPSSASGVIRRSRRIMATASFTVVIAGILGSSELARGNPELTVAYVIAFSGVGLNAVLAPYMYALQALSLSRWNLVRVSQPVLNLAAVIVWYLAAPFTVLAASICLVLSFALQMLLACVSGRRAMLEATPTASVTAGDLLRFGVKQASSAVPQGLASNLDRIVLSQVGSPAVLGQYAVAQSVVGAAAPLGTAIASVLFPRLSAFRGSHGERRRVELRMLYLSAVAMVCAVLLLLAISPWAIPLVFGAAFAPAVQLALWTAPGVVTQSLFLISTAFLRGRGRPGHASWANLLSLAVGALSMFLLVPLLGPRGAALGAFFGTMCGLGATLLFLRRRSPTREAPQV
jgi:O-antigen/teichoic acid export membrane protein